VDGGASRSADTLVSLHWKKERRRRQSPNQRGWRMTRRRPWSSPAHPGSRAGDHSYRRGSPLARLIRWGSTGPPKSWTLDTRPICRGRLIPPPWLGRTVAAVWPAGQAATGPARRAPLRAPTLRLPRLPDAGRTAESAAGRVARRDGSSCRDWSAPADQAAHTNLLMGPLRGRAGVWPPGQLSNICASTAHGRISTYNSKASVRVRWEVMHNEEINEFAGNAEHCPRHTRV